MRRRIINAVCPFDDVDLFIWMQEGRIGRFKFNVAYTWFFFWYWILGRPI
jgi:hypothetical protein